MKQLLLVISVCLGMIALQSLAAPVPAKTLILTVQYQQGVYSVINAMLVDGTFDERKSSATQEDNLVFNLKNQQGELLGQGRINNPNIVRGVFDEQGQEGAHSEQYMEDSVFVVRYPYREGMQVLSLMKEEDLLNQFSGRSRNTASKPAVEIDFSNMINQ